MNGHNARISDRLSLVTAVLQPAPSPHFSPGGETITQRFGLMKYIPVLHPFGVALRSKPVPAGLVTKDFVKEWNNSAYFQLSMSLWIQPGFRS